MPKDITLTPTQIEELCRAEIDRHLEQQARLRRNMTDAKASLYLTEKCEAICALIPAFYDGPDAKKDATIRTARWIEGRRHHHTTQAQA